MAFSNTDKNEAMTSVIEGLCDLHPVTGDTAMDRLDMHSNRSHAVWAAVAGDHERMMRFAEVSGLPMDALRAAHTLLFS